MTTNIHVIIAFILISISEQRLFPRINNNGDEREVRVETLQPNQWVDQSETSAFPRILLVEIEVNDSASVHLQLSRDDKINQQVPVYISRPSGIADLRFKPKHDTAFYTDVEHGCSFLTWKNNSGSPSPFSYFGQFSYGTNEYAIHPPSNNVGSHTIATIEESLEFIDFVELEDAEMSSNTPKDSRKRRDIVNYVVETMIVVDFSMYSLFYNMTSGEAEQRTLETLDLIRQYYSFVLTSINVRYDSVMASDFTINCIFAGIYIADFAEAASFVENLLLPNNGTDEIRRIDKSQLLDGFRNWANENLSSIATYDHALLVTAYDMGLQSVSGAFSSGVIGVAYIGGVCTTFRYSINEDRLRQRLPTVIAHELGHNLGAFHDGNSGIGMDCNATDGYVMAPSTGSSFDQEKNRRHFKFSNCSVNYIRNHLNSITDSCLLERTSNASDEFAMNATQLAGQIYPPDVQCQRDHGPGYTFSRFRYNGNFSSVCNLRECHMNGASVYAGIAWDGTSCGDRKICVGGECVETEQAPATEDESCLFGDTPNQEPFPYETLVFDAGCMQQFVSSECCRSCAELRSGNSANETTVQTTETMTQTAGTPLQTTETSEQTSETSVQTSETVIQTTVIPVQTSETLIETTVIPVQTSEAVNQTTATTVQTSETLTQTSYSSVQPSATTEQSAQTSQETSVGTTESTQQTSDMETTTISETTLAERGIYCYECSNCKSNGEAKRTWTECEIGQACQSQYSVRSQGGTQAVVKRCISDCNFPGHNFRAGTGHKYCCLEDLCNAELIYRPQ